MTPATQTWTKAVLDGDISSDKSNGQTRACLIRYLREFNTLPYRCAECQSDPVHNGKPLVFQLDHIDGNPTHNHLTNLRWLCPNCHSQTATFAGRNSKGIRSQRTMQCESCGSINTQAGRYNKRFCSLVCANHARRKKPWDSIDIDAAIAEHGIVALEKMWGISNVAIYKQRNKQQQKR